MNRTVHTVTLAVAALTLALALHVIATAHTWQGSAAAILVAIGCVAAFVWLFSHQPDRRR